MNPKSEVANEPAAKVTSVPWPHQGCMQLCDARTNHGQWETAQVEKTEEKYGGLQKEHWKNLNHRILHLSKCILPSESYL